MSKPLVSVVTCVYNDEPYLEECIRSVLAQTEQDFEYVICNNHSDDRSGEIARDYAAKDSRIRVVSPPTFVPQYENFNYALNQIGAGARYCKMLHSDDWMYPQCLQQMCEVAESGPDIVLVSAYRLIGDLPDCFGVPVERSWFPGAEACRWQLLGKAFPFGSHSTVMYSAATIRERAPAFFPLNRFFGDVDMAFRLLAHGNFGFVHQVLTYSRYQPDSITDGASHLNFWELLQYVMVEQYGREFLEPAQFEQRLHEVTTSMYRGMGEQWLKDKIKFRKKKGFWEFQRKHLGDIGARVEPALLAKGVLQSGLGLLASPSTLARKVRNELSKPAAGTRPQ